MNHHFVSYSVQQMEDVPSATAVGCFPYRDSNCVTTKPPCYDHVVVIRASVNESVFTFPSREAKLRSASSRQPIPNLFFLHIPLPPSLPPLAHQSLSSAAPSCALGSPEWPSSGISGSVNQEENISTRGPGQQGSLLSNAPLASPLGTAGRGSPLLAEAAPCCHNLPPTPYPPAPPLHHPRYVTSPL